MSAVNPYTPPRADVADVGEATTEHGELNFWSANGRIGRVRYLGWVTAATAIGILVLGVATILLLPVVGMAALVLPGLGYIALMVFCTLAAIQRSHDMGWTGWTVLLAFFVPFAAFLWIFIPGTAGRNRFGAPPPPNSTGVIVAAWLALGLPFILGILAAVSIPAYQRYVERAQAMQLEGQPAASQQQ